MSHTDGVPGRRPAVRFPIRRTVMCPERREMFINENTTVHCIACGGEFLINQDTAYIHRTRFGDTEFVRCPRCGRIFDAFYYLQEPPRPKPIRTPEVIRIPWRTASEMWP